MTIDQDKTFIINHSLEIWIRPQSGHQIYCGRAPVPVMAQQ